MQLECEGCVICCYLSREREPAGKRVQSQIHSQTFPSFWAPSWSVKCLETRRRNKEQSVLALLKSVCSSLYCCGKEEVTKWGLSFPLFFPLSLSVRDVAANPLPQVPSSLMLLKQMLFHWCMHNFCSISHFFSVTSQGQTTSLNLLPLWLLF